MSDKQWPNIGNKLVYKGTPQVFWFKDVLKNAENNLKVGEEYTLARMRLNSSWCSIYLEEFPDLKFSLSFFTYPKERTTDEVKKAEHDENITRQNR